MANVLARVGGRRWLSLVARNIALVSTSLEFVRFGSPALDALARWAGREKAQDPFVPLTVVVPTYAVGRRVRSELVDRVGGLVNVTVLTLDGLAAAVAEPTLRSEGRQRLAPPVLAGAARSCLSSVVGPWSEVATHPSTERRFVEWYEATRLDLTFGAVGHEFFGAMPVVRPLVVAVRERLGRFFDRADVFEVAARLVQSGQSANVVDQVALFLPGPLRAAPAEFARSLCAREGVTAFVGITADPAADEAGLAWLELSPSELALAEDATRVADPVPRVTSAEVSFVEAPDQAEEVNEALRLLWQWRGEGVRWDEMAVWYSTASPFERLVSEALSAADIPFDGPSTRTRADCSGGRLLRHLLALSESDWTYHDVFDLLASVALQRSVGGPLCPTVEWERVARRAGVVGGQREWSFRLRSYGEYLAADAPREAELALDLANFVEELAATVAEGERVSNESWESVADWLVALIDRYLPAPEHQSHWSAAERSDLSGLVDGLARLAVLDAVDPQPSIASVRSAVLRELDVPAEPSSAGPGVMVSTIRAAYGHTIQRVVLLGANEGMLPHVGSGVGGRSVAEQHRELLAVLASTSQACVVAYSRGGLLDGRALSPSRWLAPIQRDAGPDALRRLKSFVDTGRSSTVWPTRRERVLNLLLNEPSVGDQLPAADAELRRGIESAGARRGRVPTRFEGLVGPLPSLDGVISPTRLEQYATCGFRSLLADVLGLVDEPHPQRLEWIDPRDRGSLVHAVAEKFFREVLQRAPQDQPAPEEPWSESDFLRIDELTQRELRSVERSGRTGRLGRWKFEQAALRDAMRQFLIEDERFRSAVGGRPIAVEYRFGRGADTPFRFPLGDGREIAVRGAVDRVDQIDTDATAAAIANESSPSTLVVIDYKTSKPTPPDALAEKMAAGQLVQLPLYGAAIRERLGISGAPVDVRYWHISDRGQWAHRSFDLDAAIELVQPALRSALDGIESGTFIADPGPPVLYPRSTYDHCTWCAFDRLCPSDRGERRAALTSEIDEPVGAQPRAASSEVER